MIPKKQNTHHYQLTCAKKGSPRLYALRISSPPPPIAARTPTYTNQLVPTIVELVPRGRSSKNKNIHALMIPDRKIENNCQKNEKSQITPFLLPAAANRSLLYRFCRFLPRLSTCPAPSLPPSLRVLSSAFPSPPSRPPTLSSRLLPLLSIA